MAKNKPQLRIKQPQPRREQPQPRRKQPQATITSPVSLHDHVPFDLAEKILCRLTVKQLIRLRRVCKSWNSLISADSNFAKKHLRLSTSRQDRHHLNLKSSKFLHLQSPISTIFGSRDATVSIYSLREILKKEESDRDGGGYVSTCDGILCYKIDNSTVVLFNPSIRKLIILPSVEFPIIIYTLVYDRFINNYKIIALVDPYTNDYTNERQVNVYTLGTHYWRKIQGFPSTRSVMGTSTGIFVNDSVNWLTLQRCIVSLDLEKESYQILSLPQVQFKSFSTVTLGKLRGCLSLLIPMMGTFSEFWIMEEFGNEMSWIKLLSIPYMKEWGAFRYSKVLYISEDDQVLMQMFMTRELDFMLVVYDSINNTFNFPEFQNKIHDDARIVVPEVYVESLISPF